MYQPALWHDYFVVVGGGAAALSGLVFVAMTLHLDDITRDPVHRHRARTILTGLTAVFIRCSLVLMGGQNGQAIAIVTFNRRHFVAVPKQFGIDVMPPAE